MARGVWPLALILIGSWLPLQAANGDTAEVRAGYPRLGGSADWQLYRADGVSQESAASLRALRQKYTLDLTGAIWDFRFNRYAVSVDFFRTDRKVDGQETNTQTLGYRAATTFFPNRSFPLSLYARRLNTDAAGLSIADNDRETRAWGVEWNISRAQQKMRLQLDRAAYDLLSPVVLQERREHGLAEYAVRTGLRETTMRYDFSDRVERVNNTAFSRDELTMTDRTRFNNEATLLFNAHRTQSEARFSTGERSGLNSTRAGAVLDFPRRRRVGLTLSYDYNDNRGSFVDATGHNARIRTRVRLGSHWETNVGVNAGTLETRSAGVDANQELTGASVGLRFHRDWRHFNLVAAGSVGRTRTDFEQGTDRTVTNQSADLNLRVPLGGPGHLFAGLAVKRDENDATGVGFTFDEQRGELGVELEMGARVRGRGSVFYREASHDTFQFGIQDSTEAGAEATLTLPRGGVTLRLSSSEGISEFIPDPSSSSPFVPGLDLVNRADVANAGAHLRFFRRMLFRVQVRLEDREFTSIGAERILYYHPEIEWSYAVWRASFGLSHYERDNTTSFEQDTLLLTISRRMF